MSTSAWKKPAATPSHPRSSSDEVEALAKKMASQTLGSASSSSVVQAESARIQHIKRKKDYVSMERIRGKTVNVVEGLELHANVFNEEEQKDLVDMVFRYQRGGREGQLRPRTYSEPRKWMKGKGRVTIQFGCCYNYAVDQQGNPPGILREEAVDPMPPLLRSVIRRLVRWRVLPRSSIPDSCIINIYDVGDCIPPHVDSHDFVRPFCTLSLLSRCSIVFGAGLDIVAPGEFKGSLSIPLPTGSVLVLQGNGADVAKHAVPAVPTQRISITFRKMDPAKVPRGFTPDTDLLATQPFSALPPRQLTAPGQVSLPARQQVATTHVAEKAVDVATSTQLFSASEFPPLSSVSRKR